MTKSRQDMVLALVRRRRGEYSDHAKLEVFRLGLRWPDVIEVIRTAVDHKVEKDRLRHARHVDSFDGRDTKGRLMYVSGKELWDGGKKIWFVITFHESSRT